MKTAFILALIVLVPGIAFSAVIIVPDDYLTIQGAIDAAAGGDMVAVRPGTYTETIDFLGKAIVVRSELGPAVTTIDGNQAGSVVTFQSGEGGNSVLKGFTITNGIDGGITCLGTAAPTIKDNAIIANTGCGIYCTDSTAPIISANLIEANAGCGIACKGNSTPTLTRSVIKDNSIGEGSGGGIDVGDFSEPVITNNTIAGNTAKFGGGVFFLSYKSGASFLITGNSIMDNTSTGGGSGGGGGGLNLSVASADSTLLLMNNRITRNVTSDSGGGIACAAMTPTSIRISGNIIAGNRAASGGGIACNHLSDPDIHNNVIMGNSAEFGGGIYCFYISRPTITGNTIYGNSADHGGGMYLIFGSHAKVTNSIFWNNDSPDGPEMDIGGGDVIGPCSVNISYSCVKGGKTRIVTGSGATLNWGAGMIKTDPGFADPAAGDLHLTFNSPCRNAGTNNVWNLPDLDFEGDPRITPPGGAADIGADEFWNHLYHTGTVSPGETIDIKVVAWPGKAPVRLMFSTGVQDPPRPTPYGGFHLAFPLTADCLMDPVPAGGISTLTLTVPAFWNPGERKPMQALLGPLGQSGTALTNLLVLEVE